MQTAHELSVDEVLTKDHNAIKKSFSDARTAPTRAARRDELNFVRQKIRLHETFEKHYYYPIALECLGVKDPIIGLTLGEHNEIERLLNETSDEAAVQLENVIATHIYDEEKKLFPAVRDNIDTIRAQTLGRHYEQISDITDFTSRLIKDVRTSFPHLSRNITILMTDCSPNFHTSAGSVEIVLQSTNQAVYSHLSLLSGLIAAILRPLARQGYDASVLLYREGSVCTGFLSCPHDGYFIPQTDDLDPSHPMSALWLDGTRTVSFDDLPRVLSRLSSMVVLGQRKHSERSGAGSNLRPFVSRDAIRKASPKNASFTRAFNAELPDSPFRRYLEDLGCLPAHTAS